MVNRQVEGNPDYPLFLITDTSDGAALVRWVDQGVLLIVATEGGCPRYGHCRGKFDPGYTTTVWNRESGQLLKLGDCSSRYYNPHQVVRSPDASLLAYAVGDSIWLVNLDTQKTHLLAAGPTEDCYNGLRFSPDGRWLAFYERDDGCRKIAVRVVEVSSGEGIYTHTGEGYIGDLSWSGDSVWLAFYTNFTDAIWHEGIPGSLDTIVVDVLNGQENKLPSIQSYTVEFGIRVTPQWLVGETMLLLPTHGNGSWLADISKQQVSELAPGEALARHAYLSPKRDQIAFSTTDASYLYDISSAQAITLERALYWAAWSPTGQKLLTVGRKVSGSQDRYPYTVLNVKTGEQYEFSLPKTYYGALSWSPDERWLAYVPWDVPQSHQGVIWVVNATTGQQIPVTPRGGSCGLYDRTPQWSPDGREIAFTQRVYEYSQNCELYLVDVSQLYP